MIRRTHLYRALFFIALLPAPIPAGGTTYVVFRYDDLAGDRAGARRTSPVARRIWQAEKSVDALFNNYGVPYVVAIIPKGANLYDKPETSAEAIRFSADGEKVEFIMRAISASRVEVAQHGCAHINYTKQNHRAGEFRERIYEDQLKDILEGRDILCESLNLKKIMTFVPPFNAWDHNTAKALKTAGFAILSADRSQYHKSAAGLTIIPFTAQLWELESMVDKGTLPDDSVIVALYHPPQIAELEGKQHRFFGVKRFEKLLGRLVAMPHVKVVTLQQLAQECGSLTTNRYRKASALWRQRSFWAKLLPRHKWPGEAQRPIYLTAEAYSTELMRWRLLTTALAVGLGLTGLVARYLVRLLLSTKWHRRIDVVAAVLCCAAILSETYLVYRGYHPTGIRAIPGILTVSFLIALMLKAIRKSEASNVVT